MRGLEIRPRGEGLLTVAHSVRLDVALVHHVEPVLVAEGVPTRVIRVVTGAHRVHIQFLHDADVADHVLFGDDVALVGAHLVAVGAFDEDRLPVDQKLAVPDLDGAESEVNGRALNHVPLVESGHLQRVEVRDLGAPESRILNDSGQGGLAFDRRGVAVGDLVAVLVDHRHVQTSDTFCDLGLDREVPVHTGDDVHVLNAFFLTGVDIDPTGYTAQPPEILILQVGAVAPAEHLQGDEVLPGLDVSGDVEAGLQLAVLAVADHLSVDPDTDVGGCRADAEADLLPDPGLVHIEQAAVLADIVVFGRRIRRVVAVVSPPGIADVKVERVIVPVEFPHSWDWDGPPAGIVVADRLEAFFASLNGLVPFELPDTVESQCLLLVRDKRGGHRQPVLLEHARILPRLHLVVFLRQKRGCGKHCRKNQ